MQVEQIVGGVLFIPWLLIMQSVKQISIYSPISERPPSLSLVSDRCLPRFSATFRHDSPSRSSSSFLISSSRNKDQFTMWRRDREGERIKAAATISSSETPLSAHSARRTDGQAIPFRPRKNGRRTGRDTKLRRRRLLLHLF